MRDPCGETHNFQFHDDYSLLVYILARLLLRAYTATSLRHADRRMKFIHACSGWTVTMLHEKRGKGRAGRKKKEGGGYLQLMVWVVDNREVDRCAICNIGV